MVLKERDAETNLDYVGARYYASRTGRLTTVDPGHVGGNIFDPQSWNAYAYARNNPLRFVDPTGTDYIIAVEGGDPFWFDQGFGDYGALDRYLRGQGFRPLGSSDWGYILNTAGQIVAEYSYFSRSARVFGGAGLLAGGWLKEQLSDMAVSTAIAATGGLAAGAFGGGLAATSTLGLGGEVVSTPLIKGAIIEGFKVGNHVARKAGLGRGATTEIVRATIRGAKAAGTITNEVGTGRFAGNAIQVFVHNGVKVVVDTTSKTIMSVQKLGGFYF